MERWGGTFLNTLLRGGSIMLSTAAVGLMLTACGGGGEGDGALAGDGVPLVDDSPGGTDSPVSISDMTVPSTITAPADLDVSYTVKDADNVDHTIVGIYTKAGDKVDENDLYPPASATSFDVAQTFSGLTEGEYTVEVKAYGVDGGSGDNSYVESSSLLTVTVVGTNIPTPKPSGSLSIVFKTGQTESYDFMDDVVTDGSVKDDGFYQAGIAHSYSRDDTNGIVTDNITGLMWQDETDIPTVLKQFVTDGKIGSRQPADTSGDTAATYCDELTLGGHTDWYLPTTEQLLSLIDYSRIRLAMDPIFQNTTTLITWTSTSVASRPNYAFVVNLSGGSVSIHHKTGARSVRCVRDTQ